jgi:hypothetical protein
MIRSWVLFWIELSIFISPFFLICASEHIKNTCKLNYYWFFLFIDATISIQRSKIVNLVRFKMNSNLMFHQTLYRICYVESDA